MANPTSAASQRVPVPDQGCTVLSSGGQSPIMDVVFVHGLQGHPKSTWTSSAHEPVASAEPKPSLVDRAQGWFWNIRSAAATTEGTVAHSQSRGQLSNAEEHVGDTRVEEEEGDNLGQGSAQMGPRPKALYWPEDLLARECSDMRILTYGYDSKVSKFFGTVPHHNLHTLGRNMLTSVANKRTTCPGRPLLFICHSLGGILVKQSLVLAQKASGADAHLKHIRKATIGVIFFGTPHSGSPEASLAQMATNVVGAVANTNQTVLAALDTSLDNGQLEELRDDFNKMLGRWQDGKFWVQSFRELRPMVPHLQSMRLVVPPFSSAINNEWESRDDINRNHIDMCKFGSKEDENYQATFNVIMRFRENVLEMNAMPRPRDEDIVHLLGPGYSERDFKDLLESLKIPRSKFIGNGSSGTCEWIFSNELYIKWQGDESGIFRIQGNAGTGKSTLMKHLVTRETSTNKLPRNVIATFSFFDLGDDLEKSMLGLIRSLLHQILQQAPMLAGPALRDFIKQGKSDYINIRYWEDIETLQDILIKTLEKGPAYQFCFFVDGLDECQSLSFPDIRFLLDIVGKSSSGMAVKICFSSRPNPLISHAFRDIPMTKLEDHNADDIRRFIDHEVASTEPLDAGYLVVWNELSRKAQGVFMWVRLVLVDFILEEVRRHILCGDTLSPETLLNMISRMHPTLQEMYKRMLEKIERRDHVESARMLQVVLCAARPLTLEEFILAWAFGSMTHNFATEKDMKASKDFSRDGTIIEKQIRSRGGGLIEVKRNEDGIPTVQLIHQTVKEYLKNTKDCNIIFDSLSSLPNGHEVLVRACTSYLSILELRFLRIFFCREAPSFYHAVMIIREAYKFFTYAATYWIVHVRSAEAATQRSQAASICNDYARWIALYYALGIPMITQDVTTFGFEGFWHAWNSIRGFRDARKNVRGNPGPLSVASGCNLLRSVAEMLENGVDVNEAGGFPIQAAAHGQHHKMLLLLLSRGANIHGLARRKPINLESALCAPLGKYCALFSEVESDEDEKAVVKLLLDGGIERFPADETSCSSILCLAALRGKSSMVKLLLDRSKPMPHHEQYALSAMLALIVLGNPENHSKVTACFIAVLDSLDNAAGRRCLNRALGWIRETFAEQRYLYLTTFLLGERLKLDADTEDMSQQETQDFRRIIIEDGPFAAIRGFSDIPFEVVPKIKFTTEEPEMAGDEVHIFFPAMNSKLRTRWLRNTANGIMIPASDSGARPRLQIFI